METTVYNLQGEQKGKMQLPELFNTKISSALLHEVTVGYLANQRAGTHATKTRGEVSGGGHKPWREKGTGNARAGSNRSPLWRKGGIIFGPQPHGYYQRIPQQKRRLSLYMALSEKAKAEELMVIENIALDEAKTKKMAEILKKLNTGKKTLLLVVDKIERNLKIASRNIPDLFITEAKNLNAYEVMWARKVIMTSSAVEQLGKK